jgi:hypothetical protein
LPDKRCTHCPGSHTGERPCLASATAAARSWLLVEYPGPWAQSVDETPAPAPIAEAVRRARRHGVRPQLIRSPRQRRRAALRVFAGYSASAQAHPDAWLETRGLADPAELADLDLEAVAEGRAPGFGTPVEHPVFLVCAHGRRNACCARNGGPLARVLHERLGGDVWETTHLGGDRFAANLVCLPHGLYYGQLDEENALAAATAYRNGEIVLNRYRGRAGQPEPAQAAEHFVRAHTGELGIGDVAVESMAGDLAVVRAGTARYRVRVERTEATPCGSGCAENHESYVKSGLALLNGAALV